MDLIEVKVLSYTILLPLVKGATVASVAEAALKEFKGFNLKKPPQKVLFVKDEKNRVLSGGLTLPLLNMENAIEVVVEDYTSNDSADPAATEKLYRDWQHWTVSQLRERVQALSFQDRPSSPESELLALLREVSQSASEDVQLACLSVYRLLLAKFPDKAVILTAAESISQVFLATALPSVAIFALESFKDLSPLQLKLFDGVKYVRGMLDVDTHLMRFNPDTQGVLFKAFENVAALLDDEELKAILEQSRARCAEGKVTDVEEIEELALTTFKHSPIKKPNLGRLQSLLSSEDGKIRLYALEKVRRALGTAEGLDPHDASSGLALQNDAEARGLLTALLVALKLSIKARPAPPRQPTAVLASALKATPAEQQPLVPHAHPPSGASSSVELSTAAKLIQAGLRAPETDLAAVQLSLDCLRALLFHHGDIALTMPLPPIARHHKINSLTGQKLTNMQKVFISTAQESYRLLFTLSHADEGKVEAKFADIAEKAALFFSLSVVYGMPQGWAGCALKLEPVTLTRALSVQTPNYRLFMALTYVTHLARRVDMRGKGQAMLVTPQPSEKEESAAVAALRDLLGGNKFALLKSLWWWSIGERSNFLIRRYSLGCIAPATVVHSVAHFLWKLDPIPRLLEVLTKACRARNAPHPTFLQSDRRLFRKLDVNPDPDEFDEHLSDSYSDSEYSHDADEENEDGPHLDPYHDYHERSPSRRTRRGGDHALKADHKIIRLALKTIFNLLNVPSVPFTEQNRKQLLSYLQHLEIGGDAERGISGISLQEIAAQDRIASFYYTMLVTA